MIYLTLERDRIDHFSSNIVQSCAAINRHDQSGYVKPAPDQHIQPDPEDDISILEMM